jgi:hypothetical protein
VYDTPPPPVLGIHSFNFLSSPQSSHYTPSISPCSPFPHTHLLLFQTTVSTTNPRLAFLYYASPRSFLATHMHLVMIAQMSLSVRGRCFLRPIAWDETRYPTLIPCAVHTTHRFSPTDIPVASSDLAGPSVILRILSLCVDIPPWFYCACLQVHLTYLGGLLTHIYHRRRPLSRGTFSWRPSITIPRALEHESTLSSKSQA